MTTNVVSISNSKSETFFERHAWKLLLGVIGLTGLFGLSDMVGGASDLQNGETVFMHSITGMSWNELHAQSPRLANMIELMLKMDGAALTLVSLLSMAICLTSFRKGVRWAWFALCVIPLWYLLIAFFIQSVDKLPNSGTPVPVISGSILASICVAALGLSYRKFFRSQQRSNNGGA